MEILDPIAPDSATEDLLKILTGGTPFIERFLNNEIAMFRNVLETSNHLWIDHLLCDRTTASQNKEGIEMFTSYSYIQSGISDSSNTPKPSYSPEGSIL